LLRDTATIARFLRKLHLPTEAPVPAPARGPPYFAAPLSRVGPSPTPHRQTMPFSQ
jgi:hypothetical protein